MQASSRNTDPTAARGSGRTACDGTSSKSPTPRLPMQSARGLGQAESGPLKFFCTREVSFLNSKLGAPGPQREVCGAIEKDRVRESSRTDLLNAVGSLFKPQDATYGGMSGDLAGALCPFHTSMTTAQFAKSSVRSCIQVSLRLSPDLAKVKET